MDMLDYRMHYVVMANEARLHSLQRERHLQRQLRGTPPSPEPRSEGRGRWSIAGFGLRVPAREAK